MIFFFFSLFLFFYFFYFIFFFNLPNFQPKNFFRYFDDPPLSGFRFGRCWCSARKAVRKKHMKPGHDLNESQRDHIVEHLMDPRCIGCYDKLCLSRFVCNSTPYTQLSTIHIYNFIWVDQLCIIWCSHLCFYENILKIILCFLNPIIFD